MKRQTSLLFDIVRPVSIWVQSESLNLPFKRESLCDGNTDSHSIWCNDMCFEKIGGGQNTHVAMNHDKPRNCTPPCSYFF